MTQTVTTLASGLDGPAGVAVDASGNVYIADYFSNAIKEWSASTHTVSTLAASGLGNPQGVAVDASGNVYVADIYNNAIKEWKALTQTVSTLVASVLNGPEGVAVDASGNLYIADYFNNAIKEWSASTQTVSTLVSSGLNQPMGVVVDASGNLCIADSGDNAIKEWKASTQTLSTLVASGLNCPEGVAVDASGNLYIADTNDSVIKEWNALTQTVSTLVSSGLSCPSGVAVDASGNLYIADTNDRVIKEWNALTQTVSTLVSSGLSAPTGVAVDGSGNVYIADTEGNTPIVEWNTLTHTVSALVPLLVGCPRGVAVDGSRNVYISSCDSASIFELPRAFVPSAPASGRAGASSDALLPVLPSGELLTGSFAPTSDESWLTIGAVSGGVVNFSFTRNTGAARTAQITLLGQQIAVTQASGIPPGNLGVFSSGSWYLDTFGVGQWEAGDSIVAFNEPGATPVAGDWDGSGSTEPGFYLNGTWRLQTTSGVETFNFGFAGSNVVPVVGDWNGGGKTEVGVYADGAWFRDYDGSHTWDATNQSMLAYLGWNDGGTNTVIPVPGDWAGDGKTEMGVYCQGVWFLDSAGSGTWDGRYSYWGWTSSTLVPVAGNWSDSGTKDQFAVYNQGVWFRDADGTHTWDAANQAATGYFGWSGAAAGGQLAWRHAGDGRRRERKGFRRGPRPGGSIVSRPAG